jgi:hypothetical protein
MPMGSPAAALKRRGSRSSGTCSTSLSMRDA